MINVGLYYKVKKGHEKDFENKFDDVIELFEKTDSGFLGGKLYNEVKCPEEYMIYTVWKDKKVFESFLQTMDYENTVDYGKSILESKPRHKILGEVHP